jgi:hypothetical protein
MIDKLLLPQERGMVLNIVFTDLRNIMLPYAQKLHCTIDCDNELYVNSFHVLANQKPLWFGGVQIKKNYVSYHLMPIYLNPTLIENISSDLKKRMQGKSCFNFPSVNSTLFLELEALTRICYEDYQNKGYTKSTSKIF